MCGEGAEDATTGVDDARGDVFGRRVVEVGDRDGGPARGQRLRVRLADALGRAGDDGHAVVELPHPSVLLALRPR